MYGIVASVAKSNLTRGKGLKNKGNGAIALQRGGELRGVVITGHTLFVEDGNGGIV